MGNMYAALVQHACSMQSTQSTWPRTRLFYPTNNLRPSAGVFITSNQITYSRVVHVTFNHQRAPVITRPLVVKIPAIYLRPLTRGHHKMVANPFPTRRCHQQKVKGQIIMLPKIPNTFHYFSEIQEW